VLLHTLAAEMKYAKEEVAYELNNENGCGLSPFGNSLQRESALVA